MLILVLDCFKPRWSIGAIGDSSLRFLFGDSGSTHSPFSEDHNALHADSQAAFLSCRLGQRLCRRRNRR
jgi:hypothetical protein